MKMLLAMILLTDAFLIPVVEFVSGVTLAAVRAIHVVTHTVGTEVGHAVALVNICENTHVDR